MPGNISFFYTKEQIRNRTKTVTRRLGWNSLKPGDIKNACEKCQGLKKGEKVVVMCQIRIVSVRKEALYTITKEDVVKEGFPDYEIWQFIEMFMKHINCFSDTIVNRIEFEYI